MKTRVLASVGCVFMAISGFADSSILVLPNGYSLIADPLDSTLPGGNTLDNVLPSPPDGTRIYKWNCSGWTVYQFDALDAQWAPNGNATLNPGEGAFINLPVAATITFTGNPHVPVLPVVLPCGCNAYNLFSAQTTNAPAAFQDLTGFAPTAGTSLYRYNPGEPGGPSDPLTAPYYTVYTYSGTSWSPSTPTLNLGESAFISVPCSNAPSCCPDTGGVKYVQPPDVASGIDVNATFTPPDPVGFRPWVLADDFPCTSSGPITDIHLWGSWLYDQVAPNAVYTLAIWSDAPANTGGATYSHPAQLLWTQTYGSGQYTRCPFTNQFENFYNGDSALTGVATRLGSSSNLYYLCFDAGLTNTFTQTGTTSTPTNYWLSVTVQSFAGSNYFFGWKSSATAYNDSAVAAFSGNFYPQPGDWFPMTDPQGIPLSMAFKITTATNPCSLVLTCPSNIVVTTCSNCATVFYAATATNTCCQSNVVVGYSMPSGSCFPLGTNTVQVTAYDPDCASTPPATCSFTVTVLPGANCTNCCAGCVAPYPDSYTVTIYPGYNFIADDLCQGTNNTVADVLTGVPNRTQLYFWDQVSQSYNPIVSYVAGAWNNPGVTLSPGEGFILNNPTTTIYTLTIYGCDPTCPPPCAPATNGWSLVGEWGTSTPVTWTNLFSCPPPCGTEVLVYDPVTGQYDTYTYGGGVWVPSAPVLAVGQSVWVRVNPSSGLTVTCPTNKTVPCGSAWTFDLPVANSCCGSNITITPTGTVTNGVCPQVAITQTWLVTDACSNSDTCSQTVIVTGCCTNNPCCGPGLGAQTIQWLQLPLSGTILSDPSGANPAGTWIVTNLPCYGRVLVTQNCPDLVNWFLNPNMVNVPAPHGSFDNVETGYGPYSWGTGSWLDMLAYSNISYTVNFYFLDGQPNPCGLVLGVTGLAQSTTAAVSQSVTYRGEYDLDATAPGGNGFASAHTTLDYAIPLPSGSTGTVVGSAYGPPVNDGYGDPKNTGWALLQPASGLQTSSLPPGSGGGWPGPMTGVPYLSINVNQEAGDGVGFTVGYICCTNCLQVVCPANKTVPCGSAWTFDVPAASSCCTNQFVSTGLLTNLLITSTGIVTNGVCPQFITQTWLITDACGNSNTCSQTVTVVNTNAPALVCASDKTVQCGTTWSFDAPTATDACCTNLTITVIGNATNSVLAPCVVHYTRTWQATDCCTNTATCSQTVTVVNTNPPVLICANNKTVPCGSAWSFDAPTATDACCSNLTITVIGTVTNGVMTNGVVSPCPLSYTRTWQVSDCCSNTATCSQTVTVVNNLPPIVNVICVTNVYFAGGSNGFVTPVASTPSAGLRARFAGDTLKQFDQCLVNSVFLDTISNLPSCITSAYLTMGLKPCGDSPDNDAFNLAFTGPGGILEIGSDSWTSYIGSGNSSPGLPGIGVWSGYVNGQVTTLDLGNLPPGTGGPTSLIADLNQYGFLDFELEDDTGVDFLKLTVVSCCCSTNKTVQCGSAWTFDVPTAVDACSGAPVPATVLSTVTNGLCPQVITRTWLFTDACGNTNTCRQTVTVVNNNPPVLTCATNKTVQCNTAWNFDPPAVIDACCPNVAITVLRTVASQPNPCTTHFTRTWQATDCCGNTAMCSQTVTVVDTTPPVITCQTNVQVVALNANCQLVIPRIIARATDNCTPASQLVFSQSPPAGQVLPPGVDNITVTVTVTDQCGNSSHCTVQIIGVDVTPPVVNCPTTLVVSNCLVPCVPVTATDNCCPPASLRITQSPPCNTPLGPGINSVTVTVTDCHGNSTTKVVRLVIVGTESFLANLFNTGVDASKNLRVPPAPNGATDLHYTLGPVPAGTLGYVAPTAVVITNLWGWLEAVHISEWIAPDLPDIGICPSGNYTYTNQFVLPAGANAASASISGRWAADDGAAMYFNGTLLPANGIPVLPSPNEQAGFNHWHPFTISGGFLPNPSVNTIRFVVTNSAYWSPGPTGLRVEYTNALVNCYTCTPPSIISITPGQSLQEFSTAVLHVAAAGTPPLSYQWYLNGVPLSNNAHDNGVNTPTLHVAPLQFADAGLYTVVVSNPCGSVTGHVRLVVNSIWWWQWGWWNVAQLENPLAATAGPDLSLVGPNPGTNYDLTAGSSDDFGLPNPGGQIVNVMDVAPLPTDTSIQVPLIAPSGSSSDNSYSLIMDLYEPDTSLGTPSTLFQSISCCVSNLSSGGQDGVTLTLDAANNLHLSCSAAGVPFDIVASAPLPVDAWSRVALVVDDPQDGVAVNLALYLNGQPVASLTAPTPVGLPINWSQSAPTILSRQTNDVSLNAEFYVSSIQFHDIALSPAQLAGIGSPDNGPAPGNDTTVGPPPVISTSVSEGVVSLSWTGGPYALQETTSLVSGDWTDSTLPFTESQVNGDIMTTASAAPSTQGPSKFYRLIFRP